MNQGLIVS